jgi:Glycosyltransferase sugar-binding region containing DXD motif
MALAIPRIFHHLWLGPDPMPAEFQEFRTTWQRLHPEWEMRLWTDATLPPLENQWAFGVARSAAAKSNIARYEIVHRFGGIYVDTDFECKKNLEPLLQGVDCFAAWERRDSANNAIIGAVPDHPFPRDLVSSLEPNVKRLPKANPEVTQSGPEYFTQVLARHPEVTVFPARLFYPYQWHERWRRHEEFPNAYAVHHWSMTWRRTAWPKPRKFSDGTAPCLSVVVYPLDDGLRLEWVLEALSAQTVSDFETIVIDPGGRPGVAELVRSLGERMELGRCVVDGDGRGAGRLRGWLAALPLVRSTRVLLLDGDCMPDLNVIESHAILGDLPFVPFGFRRTYPPHKLYRFRPPIDFAGIRRHSAMDPRRVASSASFHGDWRDVTADCFSAPVEALRRWAGSSPSTTEEREVLRWLWREQYRLLPLWTGGDVTRMGAGTDDLEVEWAKRTVVKQTIPHPTPRPTRPYRYGFDRYGFPGEERPTDPSQG